MNAPLRGQRDQTGKLLMGEGETPEASHWVALPDHYDGFGLHCPIDGTPWPCEAEGRARDAQMRAHLARRRVTVYEADIFDLLARFHHQAVHEPDVSYDAENEVARAEHASVAYHFWRGRNNDHEQDGA